MWTMGSRFARLLLRHLTQRRKDAKNPFEPYSLRLCAFAGELNWAASSGSRFARELRMAAFRFLTRDCLLALAGIFALLTACFLLPPYPRQSLFGPTIDGVPWCVCEQEAREHVL